MLAGKPYCPILHARVAEIKGLQQLPEASKDLLFPLVIGRPWPNANLLEKTWEKVAQAFGARPFALDLDPFKRHSTSEKPAAAHFQALFDPSGGYENYYSEVATVAAAVPVLQLTNGDIPDLEVQLVHAQELDRGVVLHIQHDTTPTPHELISTVLEAQPDAVLMLNLGWTRDVLGREAWASGILAMIDDPDREIVVAGSSFPDLFKSKPKDEIRVDERVVFENLVRKHNSLALIYGDWGSTRPPRDPTPMGIIPPRLDLPTSREWVSFRKDGEEDYQKIAKRVIADTAWPNDLKIWGTYQIEATAAGMEGSVRSQAAAAAVRVNIHLHRQAHFGTVGSFSEGEEPYTD